MIDSVAILDRIENSVELNWTFWKYDNFGFFVNVIFKSQKAEMDKKA